MKKILLFMLPLMALSLVSCEKDNGNDEELSGDDIIQFEDVEFLRELLIVKEIERYDTGETITQDIDRNKDSQISVSEAKIVSTLELWEGYDENDEYELEIHSIDEIRYFTSLEYLDLGFNPITSLDLSKNTALEFLDAYECKLKSLDVSMCQNLSYLDIYKNNISEIDLSKNTMLDYLDCSENQLTTLDTSNNTALTLLDCYDNQITYLDLSKNTALEYFTCSGNPLEKLILPKNNKIKKDELQAVEEEYGDIIEYVE